ncbi:MAG: PAS domain S-box protein [Chitinispirillaceae bacterium]|nr:PAS domain S-box protein [Chitinispirillaceae bacterium]
MNKHYLIDSAHFSPQEQKLLDLISDAVTIRDFDNRIVFWNRAAEECYGWKRDEVAGTLNHDVLHTVFPIPFMDIQKELLLNGKWHGEVTHTCRDGRTITVATRWALRSDNEDRPLYIIEISLDITRLVEENRQANQWKAVGQLASGVAHEVRNPLNSISALMEALLKDLKGNPVVEPYIRHLKRQIKRLTDLMGDLLELGKTIRNEQYQHIGVDQLLRDSLAALSLKDDCFRRLSLSVAPETKNITIMGVQRRLTQVLINVVENAFQHSPSDSPVSIRVFLHSGDTVAITIEDRGEGIAADSIDRVFEPFFSTRKSGTGLGLFIVRHIVENHGGRVSIRNKIASPGTTVEVLLPIALSNT